MNSEYLNDHVFSVSELCSVIKETIGEMFYGLQVEGEVCNFRTNQSRHWYFSVKDKDGSILNCTCFAGNNWKARRPENGELVVLKGSLSFWPKGGSLSFNTESIRLKGEGDLRLEIEKRRAYYKSLGYFDEENKKKLPLEIHTIGIVTSAEGAVIHDIKNVTRRRAPGIDLLLFPSLVQGKGAEESISRRIRQANNFMACDVLIVCRGGGSEEDLSPYSSSEVIEAIHESTIPVISAVGHDSDFPLSDFVADLRAPTPSAAAELVTESSYQKRLFLLNKDRELKQEIRSILAKKSMRLARVKMSSALIHRKLERYKGIVRNAENLERLLKARLTNLSYEKASLDEKIERIVSDRFKAATGELKEKNFLITSLIKELAQERRNELGLLSNSIEDLNPLSILKRGYAIVSDEKGKIVKSVKNTRAGDDYTIRLRDGVIRVKAEEKNEF